MKMMLHHKFQKEITVVDMVGTGIIICLFVIFCWFLLKAFYELDQISISQESLEEVKDIYDLHPESRKTISHFLNDSKITTSELSLIRRMERDIKENKLIQSMK